MDEQGRRRAAAMYRRQMAAKGLGPGDVAALGGIPDPATVRTFAEGNSWPWAKTRAKLEEGAGLEPGSIDAAARDDGPATVGDPVVVAIEAAPLSRGQKHRLLSLYFDMLDAPSERERRGSA